MPPEVEIATSFDAGVIESAIRAAQRGDVMYPEFKRLSQMGGCVAYTVWGARELFWAAWRSLR